MGQKLGTQKLMSYIKSFGFGKKTGIDLNGEATGIIFKLDRVGEVELATTAFGQGVSVTPIQQIIPLLKYLFQLQTLLIQLFVLLFCDYFYRIRKFCLRKIRSIPLLLRLRIREDPLFPACSS